MCGRGMWGAGGEGDGEAAEVSQWEGPSTSVPLSSSQHMLLPKESGERSESRTTVQFYGEPRSTLRKTWEHKKVTNV